MPTLQELTEMVNAAGGDPQKLSDAMKQAMEELNGAQDALHKANSEAADRRKKLEAYEKEKADREAAEKTELEKAQAKAAELEKQISDQAEANRKLTIRHAVEITAAQLGFADTNDAYTLADLSTVEIVDGKVTNAEKVLKALLEKKPYLKKGQQQQVDLDQNKRNNVTGKTEDEILAAKRSQYSPL